MNFTFLFSILLLTLDWNKIILAVQILPSNFYHLSLDEIPRNIISTFKNSKKERHIEHRRRFKLNFPKAKLRGKLLTIKRCNRFLPLLPKNDGIFLQIGHVNSGTLFHHLRMLSEEKPANVREEETSLGVMWIRVAVREFMMNSVVSRPLENVILRSNVVFFKRSAF